MLAGTLKFKTVDATDFSPIKDLSGEYSISSKDTGVWTSSKDGEVYLEHLKVGLTNLIIKQDPDYFNLVINGAKVFKGEKSVGENNLGRSALMVPRSLDREMLLSLTWTSNKH